MNEKTKKYLIYGGIGTAVVGGGLYVYLKYYSGTSNTTSASTTTSPTVTTVPSTGQGVIMQNYTPEMTSGLSLGEGYNTTPEQPVVSVSSGNGTNNLNSLLGSEVATNTAPAVIPNPTPTTLPQPGTPNLILNNVPLINQAPFDLPVPLFA